MLESSTEKTNQYTFAFYNLENLFDTKNDPNKLDDDFTKDADRKWNDKRFRKKIRNLGDTIHQIGYQDISHPPVIIGVAEVENRYVLQELIASEALKNKGYDFVHFDSPDERGIDTALLFRRDYFKVIEKEAITLDLRNEIGERDFTRDILHVKGILENHSVHILINHWPSRRSGSETTAHKRLAAAKKNIEIITRIRETNSEARIIIMGDFNDDPTSDSIQHLVETALYNPMELLLTKYEGSLNYRGNWNLFDQIIMSTNFLQQHGNNFRFKESKIFNPKSLTEYEGRNKGNPFRTFIGRKYLGGMSDHFPVYSTFTIKK